MDKGKDPAFLFYSNDFYEGTRMLLPEERACYIDLLIYQHQHGYIPNDLRRLSMYCSGCSKDIIENVLNQKFIHTDNGWLNQKLNHLVDQRVEHKPKKIAASAFAGLISQSKLEPCKIKELKHLFRMDDFIFDENNKILNPEKIKSNIKKWFNHSINQMANHLVEPLVNNLENEIENEIENENIEKGGVGEKTKSGIDEVVDLDLVKNEVKNSITWKEGIVRTISGKYDTNYSLDVLEKHIEQFDELIWNDGETEKSLKEYKKHFNRWLMAHFEKTGPMVLKKTVTRQSGTMKKLAQYD